MFALLLSTVFAESIVEIVNNDPTSTWVAVEYPPSIITQAKMIAMLMPIPEHPDYVEPYVEPNAVPENFDCRSKWPGKMPPVRHQETCGSCWAFTTAEAFGARMAIKGCSKGVMSPQDLISCDKSNFACSGGTGMNAANHVYRAGITTDACLPYLSGAGRVPACPAKCNNGSAITRYRYASANQWSASNVQQEIANNGPVWFNFDVYQDFQNYRSGIYQYRAGASMGNHAVLLVGWGVQGGVKYWLCQNSWGPYWGEAGHFKFIRGYNHCNCEIAFYAGQVRC